jgi:hypothetical protein
MNSLYYKKKVTVWNKAEPNNHRSSHFHPGEQCVEISANTDTKSSFDQIGKLNDIPCTKPTLGVICQMEGKDFSPYLMTSIIIL